MCNDLFKPDIAGIDFQNGLLFVLNSIKRKQILPKKMEKINITSIWKKKGSKNSIKNQRGICVGPILRTIMDHLMYNQEYFKLDSKLSDGNNGGRNGRSSRNNLFILYAVCNSVLNGEEPIDINLYDIEKCFDTLWNEDVINSLYELGLRNDILNLIYLENRQSNIFRKQTGFNIGKICTWRY